jgi:hypothetical protein
VEAKEGPFLATPSLHRGIVAEDCDLPKHTGAVLLLKQTGRQLQNGGLEAPGAIHELPQLR